MPVTMCLSNPPVTWDSLCLPKCLVPLPAWVGSSWQGNKSGLSLGCRAWEWGTGWGVWNPGLQTLGTCHGERCVKGNALQTQGREPCWVGQGRVGKCRPGGAATFLFSQPMCGILLFLLFISSS